MVLDTSHYPRTPFISAYAHFVGYIFFSELKSKFALFKLDVSRINLYSQCKYTILAGSKAIWSAIKHRCRSVFTIGGDDLCPMRGSEVTEGGLY